MSTHKNTRSAAPSHPEADAVGPHLVIDRTEWIPGSHPEPHRRGDGQRAYAETYYRCLKCGIETVSKADFPEECDAPR